MAKKSNMVKNIVKNLKKQNPIIRIILGLLGLYVVYYIYKKMSWVIGNNTYLEGLSLNSDKTFVFFKMNGCPHCVKMEPEWKKFVDNNPDVNTETLEANADKAKAKKYNVTGYPSLLMVSGGKVIDTYTGERNSEGFAKFIDKHA
jgi:thiol-disulfide isomerase/thioredoxin